MPLENDLPKDREHFEHFARIVLVWNFFQSKSDFQNNLLKICKRMCIFELIIRLMMLDDFGLWFEQSISLVVRWMESSGYEVGTKFVGCVRMKFVLRIDSIKIGLIEHKVCGREGEKEGESRLERVLMPYIAHPSTLRFFANQRSVL